LPRICVYADEAGNFDFSRNQSASRYFILTTVSFIDHAISTALLDLRRTLTWDGVDISQDFHAAEDTQAVRDRVFGVIAAHDFRVDTTILDKPKAQPHLHITDERFYQYAWFYHMRHVAPRIVAPKGELLIVAASLGTKKKRSAFHEGVRDVMSQVSPTIHFRTASWPAAIDPALQVADYCSWAIQKKWERKDTRSYDLIKNKIRSEFDIFSLGKQGVLLRRESGPTTTAQ
jgi:hypothetical protein